MPKSEKVFELLRLIEENDQLTPEDLAILLDIHPRSVYRYVDTLVKSGFPIYYNKKEGGYKLLTKPASSFRIEELKIMKSALETFIPICEKDEFRLAKKLIRKIERTLPTQRKKALGEILIAPAEAKGQYGGTITIGHPTKPYIINPILTISTISANITSLIFNSLVRYHGKEVAVPDLAERWETSDDGLVWTFYLRDDVSFHDGFPLTAHDVAFTYRAICDPRNNSYHANMYSKVYRFETDGDYIFKVILRHFDVSFIHKMMRPIAPKHLLFDVDIHNASFNKCPIGSGPFKFQECSLRSPTASPYGSLRSPGEGVPSLRSRTSLEQTHRTQPSAYGTDDDTITLVANKDYFEKGRPFLEKVIFKTFPSQREAFEAVERGEIDITIGLLPDIELIHPSFEVYSIPKPGYYALFFNLKDPLLADIRVRQALSFAIDKEAIIEEQLNGHGKIITGPPDVNSWAYNQKVRPTPFDPKKAVLLLSEAGFKVTEEGILDRDGKPFELELFIPNVSDIGSKIAIAIKMLLAKIGIKVSLKYEDGFTAKTKSCVVFCRVNHAEDLSPKEPFQATLRMISTAGDADRMYLLWHSSSEGNITSYQNPSVDALLDEGRTTLDFNKRKEIYHKIHELIASDYPAVFIASLSEIIGSNYRVKWIENFLQTPSIFGTIKDWQIQKERSE